MGWQLDSPRMIVLLLGVTKVKMTSEDWRTPTFRKNIIHKIEEHIQQFQIPMAKNATDMENHVYTKAKTQAEYLSYIAKLLVYIKTNGKKPSGGVISGKNMNAVQKGIEGPGHNQQNMGQVGQGGSITSNVLQSLNQHPGQSMNIQQAIHNKMSGLNMLQSQQVGVNQIVQMQANSMMGQINKMNQGNMSQLSSQPSQQHPISAPQLGSSQVQPVMQMQNQVNKSLMNPGVQTTVQPQLSPSQQHINSMNANQMSQQQLNHMQRKSVEMMNSGYPAQRNLTTNQFLSKSPSSSISSPGGIVTPSSSQMVPSPALVPSPSAQHSMLGGARSIAFKVLNKSPWSHSWLMDQFHRVMGGRRYQFSRKPIFASIGMVSSPSSSLNTPAGIVGSAVSSPLQDDQISQACKEKIQKLRKYIDPLNKMILKLTNEGYTEKMSKMKKLLEILTNPSSSTKLDVLQKCEIVLEKMDFKKLEASAAPVMPSNFKEHHFFTPLLEVVNTLLHNPIPIANHTLNRTFGPCVESLFGPVIKNLPPSLKRRRVEEADSEIPDVLQGEIARLDQRFKVSLDPAQPNGSKCIQLICWLDDKHLPCVPPILVIVPIDYPKIPPRCVLTNHEYATPYLSAVQQGLDARLTKSPKLFSVSQLLDTWEISVRQASSSKIQLTDKGVSIPSTSSVPVSMQTTTLTTATCVSNCIAKNLISTAAS